MPNYDFAQLDERFDHWHNLAPHTGAQIVVRHRGEIVHERAVGTFGTRTVDTETPFMVFSCTKAFTAACILHLIDAGKVDFDAPVAAYWPAFGKHGKDTITVYETLLHKAGIPSYQIYRQVALWPFWGLVTRHVANAKLQFPAGEKFAYHIVNSGWILGEIVRRVTGMHIADYFAQEFTQPLDMARTWMKLPRDVASQVPKIVCGAPDQDTYTKIFNLRPIRMASMPAGGMKSTARDMALFYQMLLNNGSYAGRQYLKPETIAYATKTHYEGPDHEVDRIVRFGLGFHLGGKKKAYADEPNPTMGDASTARTFGHHGNRSCMAWADPDNDLAVAFTTNYLLPWNPHLQRWKDLSDGAWAGIGKSV